MLEMQIMQWNLFTKTLITLNKSKVFDVTSWNVWSGMNGGPSDLNAVKLLVLSPSEIVTFSHHVSLAIVMVEFCLNRFKLIQDGIDMNAEGMEGPMSDHARVNLDAKCNMNAEGMKV